MQRYTHTTNHGEPWSEPDEQGDWVLYEDAQAAIAAAVKAERERLRCAVILRSQETYGVLMQEHAEAAVWIADA